VVIILFFAEAVK